MITTTISIIGPYESGKTSLIEAITGFNTDNKPDEIAIGESIELGYANYKIFDNHSLSIIDTPGNPKYVKKVINAAYNAQVLVIVISAEEESKTEIQKYLNLAKLLNKDNIIIVINKVDKVSRSVVDSLKKNIADIVKKRKNENY